MSSWRFCLDAAEQSALGGAWLATVIVVGPAMGSEVTPFLLGSLLKSALGAAILKSTVRDRGHAAQ